MCCSEGQYLGLSGKVSEHVRWRTFEAGLLTPHSLCSF
jgi:hypothetical protein